ncbi:MAG TPA: hypothetical protein ENN17_12650 [bacterium]|nr:hypothetical protein [bacterium]
MIPLLLLIPSLLFSEIFTGLRLYNNRWQKTWLYTPAPVTTIAYRFLAVEFDGAAGTYAPAKYQNVQAVQHRFSCIPMLHLTRGVFILQAGAGLSYKYLRNDFRIREDRYRFASTKKWERHLRLSGGLRIPLTHTLKLNLMAGYDYLDSDNYAFSVTGGVSIAAPWDDRKSSPRPAPRSAARDYQSVVHKEIPASPSVRAPIGTVTVVSQNDPVITDVNTTIESTLLAQGIRVLNWDKLRQDTRETLSRESGPDGFVDEIAFNDVLLASYASRLLELDAMVQTEVNYRYVIYGVDASVLSGSIKFTHPASGQVLQILRYDGSALALSQFKKKVEEDILALLPKMTLPVVP